MYYAERQIRISLESVGGGGFTSGRSVYPSGGAYYGCIDGRAIVRIVCALSTRRPTGPLVGRISPVRRLWRVTTRAATAEVVPWNNLSSYRAVIRARLNITYSARARTTILYKYIHIIYYAYVTCCSEDPVGNTDPNDWIFIGRPRAPLQPLDQNLPRTAIRRRRRRRRQSCIERASVVVYDIRYIYVHVFRASRNVSLVSISS